MQCNAMNYCSSSDRLESVQSTDAVEPELSEDEQKISRSL